MLNSLQMMSHVSPLDLMAAAGHYHAAATSASSVGRIYNSPPPISTSDPLANECKLVDYRGQKVAAFTISGETMLCLPQAVEMFLKHAVGGPHTVYCKLKRLDIEPLVCNVEQVRILRALGAIQPFVNRCKLLSIKDFDILYGDCTTKTISKAGRPAKKVLSPAEYTGAQLKKYRLDSGEYGYENENLSRLTKSHHQFPPNYSSHHQLNHMALMQMNQQQQQQQQQQQHHHPVSAALLNSGTSGMPTSASAAANLPRLDSSMMIKAAVQAGMSPGEIEAIVRSGIWGHTAYEDMIKHLERLDENDRPLSCDPKNQSNEYNSKSSPVLNLSKSNRSDPRSDCDTSDKSESLPASEHDVHSNLSDFNVSDGDGGGDGDGDDDDDDDVNADDDDDNDDAHNDDDHNDDLDDDDDDDADLDDDDDSLSLISNNTSAKIRHHQRTGGQGPFPTLAVKPMALLTASAHHHQHHHHHDDIEPNDSDFQNDTNLSVGTLLWNIQTLLKVAADNARQHEKQTTYEKAELKMDFMRERDVKDSLERQLVEERKLRVLYQKRYSRERKLGVRLKSRVDGNGGGTGSAKTTITTTTAVKENDSL